MRAIAWLLRVFCYLFHTILSLALLALGGVAILSSPTQMTIETLPWQGVELNHWLVGLGILGLFSVILAISDLTRFLLPLWSILVLVMLIKGVFFTPAVTFSGHSDFHNWLLLITGAVLALIGSFTLFRRRRA